MGTLEFGTDTDYKVDELNDTDCDTVDKLSDSYTYTDWHAHLLS